MDDLITKARGLIAATTEHTPLRMLWTAESIALTMDHAWGAPRSDLPGLTHEDRARVLRRARPIHEHHIVPALAHISECHVVMGRMADEIERLHRIIAVEQGDESQAPEGWATWDGDPVSAWMFTVEAGEHGSYLWVDRDAGQWRLWHDRTDGDIGHFRYAIEAIEAADAWLKENGNG